MGMIKHSQSSHSNFAMSLLLLEKKLEMKLTFCSKVILSLQMGVIKHPQRTKSNKFAISLQYLKKEVRNRVHFSHADKHQSFYKLGLLLIMVHTRLVIFLQCIKKEVSQLLLCSVVMQNIEIFYVGSCHVHCQLFPCNFSA